MRHQHKRTSTLIGPYIDAPDQTLVDAAPMSVLRTFTFRLTLWELILALPCPALSAVFFSE
jgi:hypothetical protein